MATHIGDAYIRLLLEMGELKKNMTEAEKLTASATREMQSAWMKVGAVYGTVAAAGGLLMKEIAGTAMRTQELGIVLGVVASNAEVTAETTAQLEAEMKDLGMTTQAARTIITRMIQTNVDLSKATDLVRVAQDMAVISMEDSSTAAEGLMRAIVTMNPILLRKYGIMTGLEDIDRRAGEALGILTYETEKSGKVIKKWTRDITAAERQQAIFNMILEEGGKFAGTYAGAMEAPGKAMRSFSRYIMEAQEAIGQYWLPVLNAAVGAATNFIKAFIDAPEIVHQLASALLVATTVVAGLTAAIIAKTLALGVLSPAFAVASAAAATFGLSLGVATAGLTLIVAALVLLYQQQQKINAAFADAESQVLATTFSYGEYVRETIKAAEETGKLTGTQMAMGVSFDQATSALVRSKAEFRFYMWAVKESEGAVKTFADAQAYLVRHLADADRAMHAVAEAQRAIRDGLEYGEELFRKSGIEVGKWAGRFEEAMASTADAMTVWDYKVKDSENYWNTLVASTEKGAITMRTAFNDLEDEVAFWGEAMESTFVETMLATAEEAKKIAEEAEKMAERAIEALKRSLAEMGKIVEDAYGRILSSTQKYHDVIVKLEEELGRKAEEATLKRSIAQQQSEEKYQRSRLEAIAKYEAAAAALVVAGETERLTDLTRTHEQKLAGMQYAFDLQEAERKQSESIQTQLAQTAHTQRLYDAAQAHYDELVELQAYIGSKLQFWTLLHQQELDMMGISSGALLTAIGNTFGGMLSASEQFQLTYQLFLDNFEAGNIDTAEDIIGIWQSMWSGLRGAQDEALADLTRRQEEFSRFEYPAIALPEMPDWSQWVEDFSETAEEAEKMAEKAIEALKRSLAEMGKIVEDGYGRMLTSTETYHDAIIQLEEDFNRQITDGALQGYIDRELAEQDYHIALLETVTKYNDEAAALRAAGETERLEDLIRAMEQELAEMEYAYGKRLAETERAATLEAHLSQVAQAQRVFDAAQAHYDELVELQQFIGNKLSMWVELHKQELDIAGIASSEMLTMIGNLFSAELSLADSFTIEWQKLMESWAEGNISAVEASIKAIEGFGEALAGELEAAESSVIAAQSALDDIIRDWAVPVLELPEMPDWSQWTEDFASSAATASKATSTSIAKTASEASKATSTSVVKTLEETMIDIADGFAAAMDIFARVAEYETPTGLAKGMEILRKDIEEAVGQLYQAYLVIGEEGIESAQLVAKSVQAIIAMIGDAVQLGLDLAEDPEAMKQAIHLFFVSLGWFLEEFANRAEDFGASVNEESVRIAQLIEQTIGAVVSTVQPLLDLVDYIVQPEEFTRAINLLFDHLGQFTSMFTEELATTEADIEEVGWRIGISFIEGIISGLRVRESALYDAIWLIVQNAIDIARRSAEIASFSKLTFKLGAELTEGFIRGMQANQQGVIDSLAGMLAMPMTFAPQLAGAGGGETHYHYEYNEAEGIGADARASLRQQYEAMELYERLRS